MVRKGQEEPKPLRGRQKVALKLTDTMKKGSPPMGNKGAMLKSLLRNQNIGGVCHDLLCRLGCPQEIFNGGRHERKRKHRPKMTVRNERETFLSFLSSFDDPFCVHFALEATGNFEFIYKMLRERGFKVSVAHPKKAKAIASAKIKNDRLDAKMLAHLLRSDLLPTSYGAPFDVRELRDLVRHRMNLVRDRTRLKNRIYAVLSKNGLFCPYSDL